MATLSTPPRSAFWSTLHAMAASLAMVSAPAWSAERPDANELVGTWTLVAADLLHTDGTRTRDYGAAPDGLMVITADGRYAVQIYDTARPRFAAGDKTAGTDAEYKAASLGASIHFGTIEVDPATQTITLHLQRSTYPNQEGTTQTRHYALRGDVLSYRVPARPDGNIPLSEWRRVK